MLNKIIEVLFRVLNFVWTALVIGTLSLLVSIGFTVVKGLWHSVTKKPGTAPKVKVGKMLTKSLNKEKGKLI